MRKNFLLLFRNKRSVIAVMLGPLLMILLVGLAFNNAGAYKIKVGFFAPEKSDLAYGILESLENSGYHVKMYDSNSSCIQSVSLGESNICMLFSGNFAVTSDMTNSIDIFVDYSEFNLAHMVIGTVENFIGKTSKNLTQDLTTSLIEKIEDARSEVDEDRKWILKIETTLDNNIKKDASEIKSNINSQDLSIDKGEFKTSDIGAVSGDMQERASLMVEFSISALKEAKALVRGLNLTDEEAADVLRDLDQSINNLETRDEQFQGKDQEIQDLMDDMEGYITTLEKQLNDAKSKNKDSVQRLQQIEAKVQENKQSLQEMRKSFDRISDLSRIQVMDAESIAIPIETSLNPLTSEKTHLGYLFPALLVLFIMFVGILLSATLIVTEKKSNAHLRNYITPTKSHIFIIASYLTSLSIILAQLIIILLVALIMSVPAGNILSFILSVIIVTSLFIAIGMVLGYINKSEESTILGSILVSSIFLLLSDLILPLESMHPLVMAIAGWNPFFLASDLLKKIMLYNIFPLNNLLILIGYVLLTCIVIFFLQGRIKRKYLPSLHRKEKV